MRDTPIHLLLVEDNSLDVRLLREPLKQAPFEFVLTEVGYMREAESRLATNAVDIILLDLGLPDAQGLEAVRRARAAAPRVPLIVLTGCEDELVADQALQEGAQDFLVKGQIETAVLLRTIRYATQRMKAEVEMQKAQEESEAANRVKGAFDSFDLDRRGFPGPYHALESDGHQHFRNRRQRRGGTHNRRLRNPMAESGD